jgi:hypothetical protein
MRLERIARHAAFRFGTAFPSCDREDVEAVREVGEKFKGNIAERR